ncbi:MAG: helix-turn-helix domain-containing protein [Proteobacteria bacterium]|nr:helix-turn-helix domain-containing protein [Pseudomonadota bacterium]
MRRTRFDEWPCPIARATDLVGDWWTPIILRNACAGQRRFDQFQQSLGVPRAILSRRLNRLVDEGLLRKERYAERPPRYEYLLTEKGRAFWDVLAALWRFGEDWMWEPGKSPPVQLVDRETGREIRPVVVDENTGQRLDLHRVRMAARKSAAATPAGS